MPLQDDHRRCGYTNSGSPLPGPTPRRRSGNCFRNFLAAVQPNLYNAEIKTHKSICHRGIPLLAGFMAPNLTIRPIRSLSTFKTLKEITIKASCFSLYRWMTGTAEWRSGGTVKRRNGLPARLAIKILLYHYCLFYTTKAIPFAF